MGKDIINLMAETGRDIIDDDAEPVISFTSTSATGTGVKAYASGGGTGADIDSTTGTGLTIDSTSGTALDIGTTSGTAIDVDSTSGTGIDVLTAGTAALFKSSATTGRALDISQSVMGSVTVAPLRVTASTPSQVYAEFVGALISTASLTVHAGAFPVFMKSENKVVYLVGYEVK